MAQERETVMERAAAVTLKVLALALTPAALYLLGLTQVRPPIDPL
jgi:hypothetical protein